MKSVSKCLPRCICKVSFFLLCLQDSLWTFPVLELLFYLFVLKKPLRGWSLPRSLFFVTLKLLLNSSAFLMEYCIALRRGKQKQTNQPNKTNKQNTKGKNHHTNKKKNVLNISPKGKFNSSWQDLQMCSFIFSIFFILPILFLLEKPTKRVSYCFHPAAGKSCSCCYKWSCQLPTFPLFFFGSRCCSWYGTVLDSGKAPMYTRLKGSIYQ